MISPAKEEVFARRREQIRLFSIKNYTRFQNINRSNWLLIRWWRNWTNPYREHDYFRFRSGYTHQWSLIALGLVVLIALQRREIKRMPVRHLNEAAYTKAMEKRADRLKKEEEDNQDPKPFVLPFGEEDKEEEIIGMDEDTEKTEEAPSTKPDVEVMIYDRYNQDLIFYDCERMYNFAETKYLINVGEFGDQAAAEKEIRILGDAGIFTTAVWEGCFTPGGSVYVMYVEDLYGSINEAQLVLDSLDSKLRQVRLRARIQPLSPLIR